MDKIIGIICLVYAVFCIGYLIGHRVKAYKDEKQAKTVLRKFINRRQGMDMEGTNFRVTDAELIRFSKEFTGEGGFGYVTGKTIITKEEFIACYNAWIKNINSV